MTTAAFVFRQCLEDVDTERLEKAWENCYPHLPVPKRRDDTLIVIHTARTMTDMPLRLRAYSHRWLLDHGHQSYLPDELKPSAERLYPKVATAVGLSINTTNSMLKPAMPIIRGAMEQAVQEAYADGKEADIPHIKKRIQEARDKAKRQIGIRLAQG